MVPFYGWGSTSPRLRPFRGDSLLFTTKFPEIPGTHFIDLERMNSSVDPVVLDRGPLDWESSALTTRPLLNAPLKISKIQFSSLDHLLSIWFLAHASHMLAKSEVKM